MNYNYAIFDDLGLALETRQSSTVITPTATSPVSLATLARASFPKASGRWYFTMLCWGDEALTARIGIATASASTSTALGGDANGYGLDTDGNVYNGGTGTTALTFGKGDEVGVLLDITTAAPFVQWFVNGVSAFKQDLTNTGPWYIAASIACTVDYGVQLFLNAGQRAFKNPPAGAEDGWYAPVTATQGVRMADTDFLTAPDYQPPNLRYRDVLQAGAQTQALRELSFWPWGNQVNSGAMTIQAVNDGSLTPMLTGSPRDMSVTVERDIAGTRTSLYTAVVDAITADSDGLCTITCRDPLALLQVPLQRWMIRPDRDPASANTPRPVLLGACRNVPIKSIDAINYKFACADSPMMGIGFCRVAGYPLDPAAGDFTLDDDKIGIALAAEPDGVVTLDASSVGGQQLPSVADDILGGKGAPFTGNDGSSPTGWDDVGGDTLQSTPVMNSGVLEFPIVQVSATIYASVPIYTSGAVGSVSLVLDWLDASGNVVGTISSPAVTGTQAWATSELIDTAPASASSARIRAATNNHTAGIIRIGTISAYYVRYGEHTAIGLTNPDFESGLTGWSSSDSGWTLLSSFGWSGSQSVKYNAQQGSRLSNAGVAPVTLGQRISASCMISLDGRGGSPYGAIRITWMDASDAVVDSSRSNSIEHSNGGKWQLCSVVGNAPQGAAYAVIQLEAGNGNGGQAGAIFDTVQWDFVLEPTGGQRTLIDLGDFTTADRWTLGVQWTLQPAGPNGPSGAAYAEHTPGAPGVSTSLTAARAASVRQAVSYTGWAGISTVKFGAGKSYRVVVTIPSLPEDGETYIALATGKDITDALASWNKAGTYMVVVTNSDGVDKPLYLLSVPFNTVGDTTPTPPTVSSLEVMTYDDTYTPDPRDTTPALLQPIKFRDYVQAILGKHDTGITWDDASATAIDTDSGYAGVGVFFDQGETIVQVIDMALQGYTACKWCDADGNMKFTRMVDPATVTSVGTIDENAMLSDLVPSQDTAPALSTRMGARRNWKKFADGDLVAPSTNFPPAVRQYLMADYQQVMASAKAINNTYIHAKYADPAPSAFDNADDAQTEIDRVCDVYTTQRWFYTTSVALDAVPGLDLGQIWSLVYPLYGLAQGKNVMVTSFQPDFIANTAQITLWG